MRILLVGILSWNPERIRSLCERGHRLWGFWSRSMHRDQGPYQALHGCVQPTTLENAAPTIREQRFDCSYSLFQAYHPRLWGPARGGVEHDIWTLLRTLIRDRARGGFDAPIVRHWGFDIQNLAPDAVGALDGQIFSNREKFAYWASPLRRGGSGIDLPRALREQLCRKSAQWKARILACRLRPVLESAGEPPSAAPLR